MKPIEIIELHAGPYLGILLHSNVEFIGVVEGVSEIEREHLKALDYGLSAGFALTPGTFMPE